MVLTGMLSQPYRPTKIGTIVTKETPKMHSSESVARSTEE